MSRVIVTYVLSPTKRYDWWITIERNEDGMPILHTIRLHRKRRDGKPNF